MPEINTGELNLIKNYGEVALTGISNKFEFYFPPLDKWFSVYAYSPIANHVATVSEDITESKEATESLKNQELFISTIADTIPAIFYVYDLESNSNIYVNSGIERLLGFSAIEIQDMGASILTDLVHPDDFTEVVAIHSKISSALDEDCFDIEYRVKHKDGTWRYLHSNERIFLRNKDGSVKQKIGIAFDITDRKQVEESLRESEKLLREAHRTAHIAHWTFNPATGTSWWSEELYRIYGLNPSDAPLSYAEHSQLIHPDDWEWVDPLFRDAVENGTPFDIVLRIIRPDGSERVLNAICQPVKDSTGAVIEMRGTIQDITKIKQAEVQLKESERRYRTLVDNLPGMVYRSECAPNFVMQFVSDGCEAISGYTRSELTGESAIGLTDVVHPSDQQRISEITQRAVRQNQPYEYEYRIHTKDGRERWMWEQGRSISMGDGEPLFLEGYIADITDKKLAQEALTQSERQLRATFEQAAVGIARVTTDGRWLDVNEKLCHIVGYTREELLSRTIQDITYPQDLDAELALIEETLSGERSAYALEQQYIKRSGDCVWIRLTVSLVRADDNTPLYFISIIEDIDARKKADEKLREAAAVFRSTGEGVMITDTKATIVEVNDAFTYITGYSREEVIGQNTRVLKSGRHDNAFYQDMWGQLTEHGQWHGEIWNRAKNGSVYPERLTISSVESEDGKLEGYVGVFADISSLKATEARLNYLAYHDPLTDLPNRLLFRDRLAHALLTAKRRDTKVAVVFLDLDRFKNINDALGHSIGDGLLIEVAKRIKTITRLGDTFGRMSGDEFCLIFEDIRSVRKSVTTVRRLLSVFNESFEVDSKSMWVTASIGIAIYPDNSDDPDALLSFADAAMYEAKEAGRNTYRYYSKEMTEQTLVNQFVQSALQDALKESQFFLVYQPQVDLATQGLVGLETLVRWEHPERGLILPGSFIPIAENSGLIRELGVWILRSACTQARLWLDQGWEYGRMFVNVAGPQLYEADFPQVIIDCLNDSRLPAEKLGLEVTEGFVMRATEHAVKVLSELKNMGIEIAIDDFGTGYSSLSYLKQLPIDKIKIDQSFIRDMPDDKDDMAISAAVIAMGQALRMKVIAEGVENVDQVKILASQGCHQAQGYLFSRPLKSQDLEYWMAENFA